MKWIRRTLVSLLAVMGWALPASAAFTSEEQASLLKLLEAQQSIQHAIFAEGNAIRTTWPANAAAHVSMLRAILAISRELRGARDYLLTAPDQKGWTLYHLNRALDWLPYYSATSTTGAAYYLHLAYTQASAFNQSLPYASPFPASYPKVIGPHGRYLEAQSAAATMEDYAFESAAFVLTAIEAAPGEVTPSAHGVFKILDSVGIILAAMTQARYRLAFEVLPTDVGGSPFFRVLSVTGTLSVGVAPLLFEMQFWMAPLAAKAQNSGLRDYMGAALVKLADSWRALDKALWAILDFPDCTPAQQAQGCGGL